MAWRVVVVSSRAKLDYKMGFVVVRMEEGEKRIHIDDILVLMIESTAVSMTAYLLAELVEKKVKVVFCDNYHNPLSELVPCSGSYDASGKIREQIKWDNERKAIVWREIVREKIKNQAYVLRKNGALNQADMLVEYRDEVLPGDVTNREGHAAKVYFNALFDEDFFRHSDDVRNAVLNYGYTILLSCFNREVAAQGYLTQIGIWHDSSTNNFNLSSDLMEVFRPIVDDFARNSGYVKFEKDEKLTVVALLNEKITIVDTKQYINNAVGIYVRSVLETMSNGDVNNIKFPIYEF
jgi:CRISPR-associated endonuclease Cas1 subtype II